MLGRSLRTFPSVPVIGPFGLKLPFRNWKGRACRFLVQHWPRDGNNWLRGDHWHLDPLIVERLADKQLDEPQLCSTSHQTAGRTHSFLSLKTPDGSAGGGGTLETKLSFSSLETPNSILGGQTSPLQQVPCYGMNCVPQIHMLRSCPDLQELRMRLCLEMGLYKGDEGKTRSSVWTLILCDWCPYTRRR